MGLSFIRDSMGVSQARQPQPGMARQADVIRERAEHVMTRAELCKAVGVRDEAQRRLSRANGMLVSHRSEIGRLEKLLEERRNHVPGVPEAFGILWRALMAALTGKNHQTRRTT